MAFNIEPVTPEEIGETAKTKWESLYSQIEGAHRTRNGGVFVHPFVKKDAQNLSQSVRAQTREQGLRLRWKQATRGENEGFFLWVEPDTRKAQAE